MNSPRRENRPLSCKHPLRKHHPVKKFMSKATPHLFNLIDTTTTKVLKRRLVRTFLKVN